MKEDSEEAPQKYVYRFRMEPGTPKKTETEIDKHELQAYINRLLGVPATKKGDGDIVQ